MEENTNEEKYTVDNSEEIVDNEDPSSPVIYGVEDTPAPQLCVVFALQVAFFLYFIIYIKTR
jgi:hypothetical protein